MKKQYQPTVADSICDLRTRKIKKTFFCQINTLILWDKISKIIDKDYSKRESAVQLESHLMTGYFFLKYVYCKVSMD